MKVYALADPRTGKCRYIGRSFNPTARLSQHWSRPHSRRLKQWIMELRSCGMRPSMSLLGDGTERDWIGRLQPDLNVREGEVLKPVDARPHRHRVPLLRRERGLIEAAANEKGLEVASWIRMVSIEAAREQAKRKAGK